MTEKYEPGTVAVATVRGVEGVRVMWRDAGDGWLAGWFAETGHAYVSASKVTDVRPLVVLDLGDLPHGACPEKWLHAVADAAVGAGGFRAETSPNVRLVRRIADQIEAQTKPPRIPEPGPWGVVESPARANRSVRRWVRYGMGWKDGFGNAAAWDDLIDPILIREGV